MQEFHATPTSGHAGVAKTLSHLKDNVYWDTMRMDVKTFVSTCLTCQQTKYVPELPLGLLQPMETMDFIVSLPTHQGQIVIYVVIDHFSKAAHFRTLLSIFPLVKTVELFTQMVCKLHGYPNTIISDRDPIFISKTLLCGMELNSK